MLHQDIPAFPGPTFRQYLTTNYHHINRRHPDAGPAGLGHNSVNWIVEQVTATQQMGTHIDGLNHLQMGDRTYNGFLLADIIEDHGTNKLGIDTLPQVVTRGLLVNVTAVRGGERLQYTLIRGATGSRRRTPPAKLQEPPACHIRDRSATRAWDSVHIRSAVRSYA